jgi:transposase
MLSGLMWRDLGISAQDWADTPLAVRTALLALRQQVRLMGIRFSAYEQQLAGLREQVTVVDDLKAEVAELRERIGQNSSNSSKPPSSDPPSYKPGPKREPRGRKRGDRPGHQGTARRLLPAEEVDHLVELKPASCPACGRKLRGVDPRPERRQVSEVPPVRAEVTEYRRHALPCSGCGTVTRSDWPAGVTGTSFGPRAQAVVGYLTGRMGLSHRDVTEAMSALYGLSMSTGSVSAIQRLVTHALAAPTAEAARFVCQQLSQHVDETGWREARQLKWLWVNAARDVTAFEVLEGRSAAEAGRMIDLEAGGIITTDRDGAYNWPAGRRRQICRVHLARDFQALVERGGESKEIREALLR